MKVWVVESGEECEGFSVEAIFDYLPLMKDLEDEFLWIEFSDGQRKFKRADDIKVLCYPMEIRTRASDA